MALSKPLATGVNVDTTTMRRHAVLHNVRHRTVLLGLIIAISLLCLVHLGLGIYISSTVSPAELRFNRYTGRLNRYNVDEGSIRAELVFFWCTIPAVLSGLNVFATIQIRRNRLASRWIALLAGIACLLWTIQLPLEGICMWAPRDSNDLSANGNLCPFEYSSNAFYPNSEKLTNIARVTPGLIIPVLCISIAYFILSTRAWVIQRRNRAQEEPYAMTRDSFASHTYTASLVAETLPDDHITRGLTRPPSYLSVRHILPDPVAEKEI